MIVGKAFNVYTIINTFSNKICIRYNTNLICGPDDVVVTTKIFDSHFHPHYIFVLTEYAKTQRYN